MSALDDRRREDLKKLRELVATSAGKLAIVETHGDPMHSVTLELRYDTAVSEKYPATKGDCIRATIALAARYPMQEPTINLSPVVYHPNVFTSGRVCLGTKWLPTQGLDLLVRRLVQIITFDPAVLGEGSPANRAALDWYRGAQRRHPKSFPTERAEFTKASPPPPRKMTWTNLGATEPSKIIVYCTKCSQQIRVPGGRSGRVKCPNCGTSFEART
jgi:ubiquitin-protein ligase